MRLRPTSRGVALTIAGVLAVVTGSMIGSVDIVRIGTVVLLLVLAAATGVAILDPGRGRHRLTIQRTTSPNPVHVDEPAVVDVTITAHDSAAGVRLAGLRFAEQAAVELSGGRALRARVRRAPRAVALSYSIQPARRGRWPLGPLVVTRSDPFGVVRSTAVLGEAADVAVWPAVLPLPVPRGVLVGEPDRVAIGARAPSPDDAALRDYQEGDDLRRVHWRSSARRGELVVRSDERAGMRPVSVLVDLPTRATSLEWTISMSASMALAMLESGHPVRMLAGPSAGDGEGDEPAPFVHGRGHGTARAQVLDRTLDLLAPDDPDTAERDLLTAARLIETTQSGGGIVLAVLGPLRARTRHALVNLAEGGQGWAMVRSDGSAVSAAATTSTIRELRRAGWRACEVAPGEDVATCWMRLLGSAR